MLPSVMSATAKPAPTATPLFAGMELPRIRRRLNVWDQACAWLLSQLIGER